MKNATKNEKSYLATRCTAFSLQIIQLIDCLPKRLAMEIISRQLLRAATSIGANVIEATGASSRRDFVKFFQIAHKSALETRYWLYLLLKSTEEQNQQIQQLLEQIEELRRMLSSSILTARGKQ